MLHVCMTLYCQVSQGLPTTEPAVDWEKKLKEAEENEKRILESESKTVRSNCLTQLLGRCAVQLHEKYTQNYLMPFTGKVVWVLFWSTCFLLLWFVGYVPDDAWNAKAIESVATVTSYDVRERQCSYECDCYQSCTGSGDSRSCTTRCSTLGMGNARYFWLLYWFSLLFWSIPCVVVLDAILRFACFGTRRGSILCPFPGPSLCLSSCFLCVCRALLALRSRYVSLKKAHVAKTGLAIILNAHLEAR